MSCEHGNHQDACDLCDAVDAAYNRGFAAGQTSVKQQVKDLEWERDEYKRRVNLLQENQSMMRDPERILVCDILANGQVNHDKSRYALKAQAGEPAFYVRQRDLHDDVEQLVVSKTKPFSDWVPMYAGPTTNQVKAQAGESVGDVYMGDEGRPEFADWGPSLEDALKHGEVKVFLGGGVRSVEAVNEKAGVPDGYVLVPIEPTEEMLNVVDEDGDRAVCATEYWFDGVDATKVFMRKVYKAMINAAPKETK